MSQVRAQQGPLSEIDNTPRVSQTEAIRTIETSALCSQCGTRTLAPGSSKFCQPCCTKDQMRKDGRPYSEIARVWMLSTMEYEKDVEAEFLKRESLTRVKAGSIDDSSIVSSNKPALQKGSDEPTCSGCFGRMLVPKPGGKWIRTKLDACGKGEIPRAPGSYATQASEVVLGKRKAEAMDEPPTAITLSKCCTEYQTWSAMYEVLTESLRDFYKGSKLSKASTPYIYFHGAYSIVADSSVSNKTRSALVSQEL
ncbi:uncharacterized protein PHACADRAFT_200884 [Phanerochaete carnosa HHB-10118-sp]|uniref:Uncharacterized protein n=1 Tax=Phanerochaete carnosa (strain HHB-10118-sp) TaxID=650164 RepID=K5VTB4_PHACS|nr:uncharacterized protein PHACADRAFT_200884 [Phanerochaete carnosa HHB-10118-sp]EKM50035.1 hypothetical protein PHACADRAFT_200884 [Phanerochaete carnosa HHB-10118-sp]